MGKQSLADKIQVFKNFFFSSLNKEFLIFVFFLFLSGAFWLLMTLNETYEHEIRLPLRLVNVPKNTVILGDQEDTLRIVVRDKGYFICGYLYGDMLRSVDVNFQSYKKKDNKMVFTQQELQKLAMQRLYVSSRIVSAKLEKDGFYFNQGQHKRVPLKFVGSLKAAKNNYISRVEVSPKVIDVYGSKALLDSIKQAFTESVRFYNINDTLTRVVSLKKIRGVKFVPDVVRMTVYPDVLTEGSFEVPIRAQNMPEGKKLRTFPPRVLVSFVVGVSVLRSVKAEDFHVAADYNEITKQPAEKCVLHLVSAPQAVRNPRLQFDKVDYIVEEN